MLCNHTLKFVGYSQGRRMYACTKCPYVTYEKE